MAAAAKSNTNWFAVGISAAVVVVLVALGAFVVFLNNQASGPGTAPESSALVNEETGAISFGEGETEVDVFVDFICPICGQFEDTYGEQLQTAAADDEITLNIHPISILNRYSTTGEYSSLSAGAMYCVAEEAPDAALTFFNSLFANQPAENTAGLSVDELTSMAEEAGAAAAADCIADGTYMRFSETQADQHEIQGTPTVEIDGERIDNSEISTRFAEILG
ncbi:thioredoxin domain-containing protein [Microbacterium sp.]|uniref:DsbA family protein n=1 Tax=Microbacterium sp. TaxID=51671 RepID=UPI0026266619|nr:thioredoxin domain-containing protein [Microbacterium sp.]